MVFVSVLFLVLTYVHRLREFYLFLMLQLHDLQTMRFFNIITMDFSNPKIYAISALSQIAIVKQKVSMILNEFVVLVEKINAIFVGDNF